MEDFEKWLTEVCFQKPTPEAYDLAKDAWKKAKGEGRFIYHYCLSYQLISNGNLTFVDGIATLESEVKTQDDYRRFKALAEPKYYAISTIRSLTLIGRE